MASTLSLVKRATALATSGLTGLHAEVLDETAVGHLAVFAGYDDLVKAKALVDLIVELPCFNEDLGRYSASLELCGSILARSIRWKRRTLEEPARRSRDSSIHTSMLQPSPPEKAVEVAAQCESALAGVAPATAGPSSSPSTGSTPTAWDPDDALTFDSIIGNSTAKRALFEHVVLPLKLSEEARNSLFAGIRSSGNNVLLHGPPGTGKTTIAQAASQEAGAEFYSVAPSSILSKYQGESERVLRQLFDDAKKSKPSIIFLDELDALAPSRDAQDDVQSRRLLAELLLQTSQIRPKDRVVVVAATNRMDDIDIALLRRFHSRIFVGPPNHKERVDMITSFMAGIEHCLDDKQVASLADRIPGWSGSDIKSLCREACMGPLRSLYEQEGELERAVMRQASGGGAVMLRPVQMSDCDAAYLALMGSSTTLNTDQISVPMCDELIHEELSGIMLEGGGAHGEEGSEDDGVAEGQNCGAERSSPESFVGPLAPEIGGENESGLRNNTKEQTLQPLVLE